MEGEDKTWSMTTYRPKKFFKLSHEENSVIWDINKLPSHNYKNGKLFIFIREEYPPLELSSQDQQRFEEWLESWGVA